MKHTSTWYLALNYIIILSSEQKVIRWWQFWTISASKLNKRDFHSLLLNITSLTLKCINKLYYIELNWVISMKTFPLRLIQTLNNPLAPLHFQTNRFYLLFFFILKRKKKGTNIWLWSILNWWHVTYLNRRHITVIHIVTFVLQELQINSFPLYLSRCSTICNTDLPYLFTSNY